MVEIERSAPVLNVEVHPAASGTKDHAGLAHRAPPQIAPISIACRLELLPGASVIERLTNARAFGFDAVGLPGRFLRDYLEDLRRCIKASPLPLSSMSLGFEGSLLSPSRETRSACRASLLKLFDICGELAVPNLNLAPVLIQDNPRRLSDETEQDRLLGEQLPALADEARQRKVKMLIEPVSRSESDYLHTLAHASRLCATMNHPNIGVTADFYHMQMEETDIPRAIVQAGPWLGCVHVADHPRVEPGAGAMDMAPGFAALRRIGYRGFIEIESRRLSGRPEIALPKSIAYLRAMLDELLTANSGQIRPEFMCG